MERADIVQARAEWRRVQDETPCGHLVFLDESGAKTNMTRLYGRAPVGERCFDHAAGWSLENGDHAVLHSP